MTEEKLHRHIADESHWNEFVVEIGGELVTPLILRQGVQNADYLFREQRVIVELKTFQTEFFDPLLVRIGHAAEELNANPIDEAFLQFERKMFSILEAPLKRILKKANRQIRETKDELALRDHRGITICINDGFIGFPPYLVTDLLHRILARERYSSMQGLVYLTNHAVRLTAESDRAFLWWPYISAEADADLQPFMDKLGAGWANFVASRYGLQAPVWGETPNFRDARIIGAPTPSR